MKDLDGSIIKTIKLYKKLIGMIATRITAIIIIIFLFVIFINSITPSHIISKYPPKARLNFFEFE